MRKTRFLINNMPLLMTAINRGYEPKQLDNTAASVKVHSIVNRDVERSKQEWPNNP